MVTRISHDGKRRYKFTCTYPIYNGGGSLKWDHPGRRIKGVVLTQGEWLIKNTWPDKNVEPVDISLQCSAYRSGQCAERIKVKKRLEFENHTTAAELYSVRCFYSSGHSNGIDNYMVDKKVKKL